MSAPADLREQRALNMLRDAARKLDMIQQRTDHQPTLVMARRYRAKVRAHRALILNTAHPATRQGNAQISIETFGPNGLAPAIDSLVVAAMQPRARASHVLENAR